MFLVGALGETYRSFLRRARFFLLFDNLRRCASQLLNFLRQ